MQVEDRAMLRNAFCRSGQASHGNGVCIGVRSGGRVVERAGVAEARKRKLPAGVLKIIDQAKRYAEGTAVRMEVHTAKDANVVKTLAKIKLEN
jgi:hypothetical protein